MSTTNTAPGFPKISMPFTDDRNNITQAWLQLLIEMWRRIGQPGQGAGDSTLADSLQLGQNAAFMEQLSNLQTEVSQIYPLASLVAAIVPSASPAPSSAGVESRYEIYSAEVVTVTAGRIMFYFGGLLNGGMIINNGRMIEAQQ